MIKFLFFYFLLIVFICEIHASEKFKNTIWIIEKKISDESLYNPINIEIDNNYNIYVSDHNDNYPFIVFNKQGFLMKQFGRYGDGPGETSKYAWVFNVDNETIKVFDLQKRKILIYNNKNFEFLNEIFFPDLTINVNFDSYNKRFIILSVYKNPNFFFTILNSKENQDDYMAPIDKIPDLIYCQKNPLLKTGSITSDQSGNTYFASEYASIIMGYSSNKQQIFYEDKPYKTPLPEYIKEPFEPEGAISSPPINIYPETYVDIAVDNKYIYAIYSGYIKKSEFDKREYSHGDKLTVFDKKTGKYLYTVMMPRRYSKIRVTENNFYFLTKDEEIAIHIYKKDSSFK